MRWHSGIASGDSVIDFQKFKIFLVKITNILFVLWCVNGPWYPAAERQNTGDRPAASYEDSMIQTLLLNTNTQMITSPDPCRSVFVR